MKYQCDVSEWYPVLTLCKEGQGLGKVVEFSQDEVDDFIRVLIEFRQWQIKLQKRFANQFGTVTSRKYDMMGGELENLTDAR